MAAHSLVDDLLRSRGLNAEDETKYLRSWEQIPIVRELRSKRLRRMSSSDSGLSIDGAEDAQTLISERLVKLDAEEAVVKVMAEKLRVKKKKISMQKSKSMRKRGSDDSEEVVDEKVESEKEEEEEEEEEEQSVIGQTPQQPEKQQQRTVKVEEPKEMTEAEAAMLSAKRRHEKEAEAQLQDYEEKRKVDKAKEMEELRLLKEKCERRRSERKEEEEAFNERRRVIEENHRKQEEERKTNIEAERKRREEERRKKQQSMAGGGFLGMDGLENGQDSNKKRNFVIPSKSERRGSTLGIAGKKDTIDLEEKEKAKKAYLAAILRECDPRNLLVNDLKAKIKQLHARVVRLEAEKYDLERRQERQEYDLKELAERQKQQTRNKALRMGLNPDEESDLSHPPKVNVASKHDRQTDHRSYGDRRHLFESPFRPRKARLVHGSGRPPADWGRKNTEELENLRKHVEGAAHHRYVEQSKVESSLPMDPIPLQVPDENENDSPNDAEEIEA
ncbi:unnamed protein product, partial [Mesorhabditis belari]|uniref:Troponin T n=1 Tax=Mesorhabditis belari TaxID=2138241 RepID=A0AAF3ECV7_9BILA